ncbi:MAG: hypothetical protein II820_09775 [Ruminiclostridium sp.]|nr:hypothetical protein [Ruminiclostridium sp.]
MNPRIARTIGYFILFASCIVMGAGAACIDVMGGVLTMIMLVVGAVLFAFSVIWMIRKVRCPHCGNLLHLKLYDISVCPYCGKSTDPDSL